MSLRIVCPNCHTAYNATDDQGGRRVRCKQCQAIFAVPLIPMAGLSDPGKIQQAASDDSPAPKQPAGQAMTADPASSRGKAAGENRPRKRAGRTIPGLVLFLVAAGVGGSLLIV